MNTLSVGQDCPLKMYDGQSWHVIGHVQRRGLFTYTWTRNDGSSGTAKTAYGAAQAISAPHKPWEALTPL